MSNYNYNDFLADSSDDYPKYDTDALFQEWKTLVNKKKKSSLVIKQADDDMNYQQAYSQREIHIALENVLELAGERLEQFHSPDYMDADIVNAMDSIKIVKDYFLHSGEAVNNNLNVAKDNK